MLSNVDVEKNDFKISIIPQEENEESSFHNPSNFDNSKPPHNGKEITELIVSPDSSYIVTFSSDDSSIAGWPVYENEFGELNYDTECKSENIMQILQMSNNRNVLIKVSKPTLFQKSTYKIIELNPNGKNNIYFVNGNPNIDKGTFVAGTNDLFMVFGVEAVAHLYSNSTGEWKIKKTFKLEILKSNYSISRHNILRLGYFITPEKLFITYGGCNILSQWDIATMTFEKQYFLNVEFDNLHPSNAVKSSLQNNPIIVEQQILFNESKTLMAIYGFSTYNVEHQVVIYSTRSCIRILSAIMDYEAYSVLRLNFFGTNKFDEGLLVRERGIFFVEPSYGFYDLKSDDDANDAHIDIGQLFIHQPDNSNVEAILNKNYNNSVVCCSNGKIIHYDIDKNQLDKCQEDLKLQYRSRPSRIYLLKKIKELFKSIKEKKFSFTQKSYIVHKTNIRWKVFHYSGTGSTHIIAYEGKKKLSDYKFFEPRTGYIYACRPVYNGDLIMITKRGIKIFTFHTNNKKIQMCYFWDNDGWNESWKRSEQLTSDFNLAENNENKEERFFGESAEKELSEMDLLPPLNLERILDEYETSYVSDHERRFIFKELLANYLEDVTTLAEIGEEVLKIAIKKNKGNIVDLVYELVMDYIKKDSGIYMSLLSIITTSLSQLQEHYPEIVKNYMSRTSLILDHDCVEITVSELPPFFGFARDQQIFENNNFYKIYSKIKTFYCNIHDVISSLFSLFGKKSRHKIQNYGRPAVILVVPLPKFASYNTQYNFLKDFIIPESNGFIEQEYHDLYKRWNGEALLHFKWHTFGKYYYYTLWAIFTVFLLIYAIAFTLSENILPENDKRLLLIMVILFGAHQLIVEIRQFIWRPHYYFKDVWNLFDLGACFFPIATSIYWIHFGYNPPKWTISFSILLLYFKFTLFLRIFESYGRYFAIIIGVAYRVFSFLMILFIIIISFAHAFYIILRTQDNLDDSSLNHPTVNNDPNNPWNLADQYYATNPDGTLNPNSNPAFVKQPDENTNMFAWPQTALLAMYILLTGDSSPLQSWTYIKEPFMALLAVLFSFFTVIYLMNLFIGLLSNVIEDYNDRVSYLVQKAKILAEIELFYLLPPQRRWRTWFPDWIYYEAPVDDVRKKIRNIDDHEEDSEFPPIICTKLRNLLDLPKPTDEKDLSNQINIIQDFLEKEFHEFKNEFKH
ncbi:hypothetical protein C1645_876028 [Glomus cerebriforme]|uniref:Ion transport domain-containing protein n=1 Tax=Glomus cerebriforme TaxID=658196 RepID=A0A397S4Q1_9GLOM|nr:hypothetical protein C1645_882726 [Glomus cerebriforme]RIA90511.1 hypothetical protein C1645_876028 [Glomus cerebriforme]